MKYYVKIGKMYLRSIYLDEENFSNNFVKELDFKTDKTYAVKVDEKQQEYVKEIIAKVFDMEYTLGSYIEFEEVKEDE